MGTVSYAHFKRGVDYLEIMTTGRSVCSLCRSFLLRDLPSTTHLPPPPILARTTQEILQLSKLARLASLHGNNLVEINEKSQRARSCEEQTRKSHDLSVLGCLSKASLKNLPRCRFPGKIVFIKHHDKEETHYTQSIQQLLQNQVLGFDVECLITNSRPIIIQLASRDLCILWQVNMQTGIPTMLHGILSSPQYLKVGHGSLGDAKALLHYYAVNTVNIFDTHSFLVSSLPDQLRPPLLNLQGLVGLFLGQWLCKAQTRSKWDRVHLSSSQLLYASTDVWASLEVYLALMKYASDIDVVPPPSFDCTLSMCRPSLIKILENGLKANIMRSEQARVAVERLLCGKSLNIPTPELHQSSDYVELDTNSELQCAVNLNSS